MRWKSGLRDGFEKIIVICGPTGVGKTALGLQLAEEIGAEIVSADSGQIYRGLDIGTAKPVPEERKRVKFHLIDIIDPTEQFSAADFRRLAQESIRDIQGRGRQVLIVGGTGLYIKVLEGGLFEGPARDPKIREELEGLFREKGAFFLHEELKRADPEAARTIPPQNRHRLIRALEIYRLTGKPISFYWKSHQFKNQDYQFSKIGITQPRETLYRRVEERIDRMVTAGLADEVSRLMDQWGSEAPALKLIGYREMVLYHQGKLSLAETVELIKKNTRHYVKRQLTWFGRDDSISWKEYGV